MRTQELGGLPRQLPPMTALGSGQSQETWALALQLSYCRTMRGNLSPIRASSFLICEMTEKSISLTKSLSSHQPEPWILDSNRGMGIRKPLESSASFLISRHMSVGQFRSACLLNTFTAPFISHSFIHPSIRQAVSVALLVSENREVNQTSFLMSRSSSQGGDLSAESRRRHRRLGPRLLGD